MSDPQLSSFADSPHIRTRDVSRDLNPVADLIEMCFPIHKDRDGQTYLKQMRRAARDMHYLRWLSSMADLSGDRIAGFVWEEEGEILGNISMVPFKEDGQVIHMIANVAVRPDHRRKGIAKALTVRVLDLLRRKHEPRVWLQVRDIDEGAQALYRSVGFEDRLKRTTWRVRPVDVRGPRDLELPGVVVRKRKDTDWDSQKAWLDSAYPLSMRWNLPVKFNQFEAGPFQEIKNFIDGINLKHWSIEQGGSCRGVLSWQKTTTYANNLWLAVAPEADGAMLTSGLPKILQNLTRRHPLSLDLAYGSYANELNSLGFKIFRTLIWMSRELN
ncbi:MAG: GNAT family N-acetyltransferase [Anaerolineaceae bacterium]|nr:GNAT family N-acetyltransferase [Anaerolineaceae bacterium]